MRIYDREDARQRLIKRVSKMRMYDREDARLGMDRRVPVMRGTIGRELD